MSITVVMKPEVLPQAEEQGQSQQWWLVILIGGHSAVMWYVCFLHKHTAPVY